MRRYIINDDKYRSRVSKYDSVTSDSSPASFRIRHQYGVKSFGNDVGSQYECPGRDISRNTQTFQLVTAPHQRYVLKSHEIGMSDNPTGVYNDVARPYIERRSPIIEGYEPIYLDDEPRYVKLQKMPKFVYKTGRLSSWTQAARPLETRYFTEDSRSRGNAYLNDGSMTSNGTGPRYITKSTHVPKLATDECRIMVDASVGGMPPRKVTKIYLPEMRSRGTGSTDLSAQVAQLKPQQNEAMASTSCTYHTLAPVHFSHRPLVFSANVEPLVHQISVNTSARRTNVAETCVHWLEVSEHIENVDDIPERLVEKNRDESQESTPESVINATPGLLDVVSLKSSNFDKEPRSEHIELQEDLHEVDNVIEQQGGIANTLKDEVEKDFFKMYTHHSKDVVQINESKKSMASSIPTLVSASQKLESTSAVRRRFEALRKVMERDDSIHDNLVNRATSRISIECKHAAVSPGISPQRSYSGTNMVDYKFDYQYSEPSSSPKSRGRRDGIYKFKLWGHRRNEIDSRQGKEQSPRKKGENQSRPLKIQDPDYSADDKKSRRLFFFSKRSKTTERYQQNRVGQRITTARCDMPGVSLKFGGTQYLSQKKCGTQLDSIKKAWLEQIMHGVIDSTEDVHVRWNNQSFNTSSTTVLELMDSLYEGAVNAKSRQSQDKVLKNNEKGVNFLQNIQAYMVYKTIHKPYKVRRNMRTTRSIDKWFYEPSQTIKRDIELVMIANDISVFRHSIHGRTSTDLKIEHQDNFIDEMSSEEQVANIVEYEDIESIPDLPHKKVVTMDKGDVVVIPISAEYSEHCRNVVVRDSSILAPKRCDFYSLLMQGTKRRSLNLYSQLQIYDGEDGREERTTMLQEVYRSWLEKFNWFAKDDRSCRSDEVDFRGLRQLFIIEEESSVQSKSCPTIFDFQKYELTPKLSLVDISQEPLKEEVEIEEIETKPRENVAKKITDKIFSVFKKNGQDSAIRVLPKDSVAVCRKRMKMAAIQRRWQEGDLSDGPCSVPSHADKAGEIQWDFDIIPFLSRKLKEVTDKPTSILAEVLKKDKNMKTKPTIDRIPSGVIPHEDEIFDRLSSEETETAVCLSVSEAKSTGINPTRVYCMPNTADPDCFCKSNHETGLKTFRRQMNALGTPLPLPDSDSTPVQTEKLVSKHMLGNMYQTEYQFESKATLRSPEIDKDTSYKKPTAEDMRNLEEKLATLSHTTLKSLEVLSQIYQEDEEQIDNQQITTKRSSVVVTRRRNSKQATCGCSRSFDYYLKQKYNEDFHDEPNLDYVDVVRSDSPFQRREKKFVESSIDRDNSGQLKNYESPPTFRRDATSERLKYNYVVKSFPGADKCSMCSHCPNCSHIEKKISTNSATTSPVDSMLQKNYKYDNSDANATQQTQFPISRSLAAGVSHDENGSGVSDGRSKQNSDETTLSTCSGQCNKYLSPTAKSQHKLEVSLSRRSSLRLRSSRRGCIETNMFPSTKDEQETLEQEQELGGRKENGAQTNASYGKDSDRVSLKSRLSKHDAVTKSKSSLRTTTVVTSARQAPENKCRACLSRPWWLGQAGKSTLPGVSSKFVETEYESSPAPSQTQDPLGQSSGIYRSKSKTTTTSIFNVLEERLKTLSDEDTEQNMKEVFIEKFSKLDMPSIIEVDSKETILVGNKRKTPSTEKLRDLESPQIVRKPTFAAPKSSLRSESQNKYIPLEVKKGSDQIEISFKVKINPGANENNENLNTRQRYKTQPDVYVLGNQQDKTEADITPNNVNIQIIIKPHRSDYDLSHHNTQAPMKPKMYTNTGTSRIYSVNRSATELSIQKKESDSGMKVKCVPSSEGKSIETSLNSEGSSKEQNNQTGSQRVIKPVNRTVASPFKVLYKCPLAEENTGTEMIGMQSPAGVKQFCTCGRRNKRKTQADTWASGTDSMKNYFRASSQSETEVYPSKSNANSTCSGPYKQRTKTWNVMPKSKLIQTYTNIDGTHDCECKKATRPSQVQRSNDSKPSPNGCKNQCFNCNIEEEQTSDSYLEVVDTGTQYSNLPNCQMCFVKKYSVAPTLLEPVDFRMLNVGNATPSVRNLQNNFVKAQLSTRHEDKEITRPSSPKRIVVVENRDDSVTDESKVSKHKKRFNSPMDILQSYEMKKAVLELYAQTQVCQDCEGFVAKLPEFVYGRETDINKFAVRSYTDLSSHVSAVKD